jgi:hypothetical protein
LVLATTSCITCGSSDHGVDVENYFLCFWCYALSSETDAYAIRRDDQGWWVKKYYSSSSRTNRWSKVPLNNDEEYDDALYRYIGQIIVE